MYLKISGIYAILNIKNEKAYIGSAVKIKERWWHHKNSLVREKHFNRHLQNAWKKYGEINFLFVLLELCEPEKLIEREQYYIDTLKPEYNSRSIAKSNLGFKHSSETKLIWSKIRTGKKASSSTKLKLSKSRIGNQFGRKSEKWPCQDGSKCKCPDCLTIWRFYWKAYNDKRSSLTRT